MSRSPDGAPTLHGYLECASRVRIAGWAQDPCTPDVPVGLLVTADEMLLARVLADQFRVDLAKANIGDGRHSFEIELNTVLPLGRLVIAVRRESDGTHLRGSPVLLEAVSRFDTATQAQFATLIAEVGDDAALNERLVFLYHQTERLLQQRADRQSRVTERRVARRGDPLRIGLSGDGTFATVLAPPPPPRALFIDDVAPTPSRDAGSNAVLSHMRAMRRLGFEVNFVASDMLGDTEGALRAAGVICRDGPWYGSVEEVLRRETDSFDLVYLHRVPVAARYLELVRHHQKRTRLVYSVADLHHLRFARQARAEQRPELMARARRLQASELLMAAASDVVITHSTHEATLLRQLVPSARVHVVPWSVPPRRTKVPFAERHGVAFIGHYRHSPNLDAAQRLIEEVMPRVRAIDPTITCLLVGGELPEALHREWAGIQAIGHVAALGEVFDRVRLTVAPLAFGAGIKGKVLESLAAGVPCVCTPIAAEGLELPPALRELVTDDASAFAGLIARLHADEAFNANCGEAGLTYTATELSESRIDRLLHDVAGLTTVFPRVPETGLFDAEGF